MELLTVEQTAIFLQESLNTSTDIQRVYYLIRLCKLDCLRIRRAIRIPKGELIDYVERQNKNANTGRITRNSGYPRPHELFTLFSEDSVQDDRRKTDKRIQRRRQRMEYSSRRFNRIPRRKSSFIEQQLILNF